MCLLSMTAFLKPFDISYNYVGDIMNEGNGMGFNDLNMSSDNVALGNGMLLLTGIGLAYLQIRRNKKENKN